MYSIRRFGVAHGANWFEPFRSCKVNEWALSRFVSVCDVFSYIILSTILDKPRGSSARSLNIRAKITPNAQCNLTYHTPILKDHQRSIDNLFDIYIQIINSNTSWGLTNLRLTWFWERIKQLDTIEIEFSIRLAVPEPVWYYPDSCSWNPTMW